MREHVGVADLGRPLQIRVLHGQVPGAQHRVAAAPVDQVVVRAEADAARIEGVPPFQWPARGGVPDDELASLGDRPDERAVGENRTSLTLSRCPRSVWTVAPVEALTRSRSFPGSISVWSASRVPSAFTSRVGYHVLTSSRLQIRSPVATSYAVNGKPVYRVRPSGLSAIPWTSVPVGTLMGGVDGERRSQTTA